MNIFVDNYYLCSMSSIEQYIESLIKMRGHSQSDIARAIGVPRQSLSYVIAGRRDLSMSLALKLESYFNLREGELLKKLIPLGCVVAVFCGVIAIIFA